MRSSAGTRARDYDLSRRSYDLAWIPAGGRSSWSMPPRTRRSVPRAWPVIGNFPRRADSPPGRNARAMARALKITQHQPRHPDQLEISLAGHGRRGGALDDHAGESVRLARDRSKSFPTWNGCSIGPTPTAATPSTTGLFAEIEYVGGTARRAGPRQAREGRGLPRLGSAPRRAS